MDLIFQTSKIYKKGNKIRIKVSPKVWKYILESYPEEIEKIKKSPDFKNFSKWVRGEEDPTIKQVKKLAKKLYIPLRYFYLPDIPKEKLPVPFYRKGRKWEGKISVELRETIKDLQEKQIFLSEYLRYINKKPLKFVGILNIDKNPVKCAQKIREILNLDIDWNLKQNSKSHAFNFLRDKLESIGIFVFTGSYLYLNTKRPYNSEEFKGFSLVDKYAPVVFINTNDFLSAQIFTLTHELVHIFVGEGDIFSDGEELDISAEKVEVFSNKVSAEILVPGDIFENKWKQVRDFIKLGEEFKVSPLAIAIRAKEFKKITQNEYESFKNEYLKNIEKILSKEKAFKSEGANFYLTFSKKMSKRFVEILLNAVTNDFITYRDAYNYLGIRGKTFDEFIKFLWGEMKFGKISP